MSYNKNVVTSEQSNNDGVGTSVMLHHIHILENEHL